jgi:hypothetical protein
MPVSAHNGGITFDAATKDWLVGQGLSASSSPAIVAYNNKWVQVGTLTGLTGDPVGIATDAKGTVWASNYPENTLTEYAPGAKTPTATYTDANLSRLAYVTLDKNDNVYVSGQSAGSGNLLEVDELSAGSQQFSRIQTITGTTGGGIEIAHTATDSFLWVCDEGNGSNGTISAYTIPGYKQSNQFAYSGDDTGIAVASSGKEVYAVSVGVNGSEFSASIVVYNAKTGKVIRSSPSMTTFQPVVGTWKQPSAK